MIRLLRNTAAGAMAIFLAGCSEGLLAELDRLAEDPSPSTPSVESFATELSISVTWPSDPAADEYVLERADDSVTPVYAQVYRGDATFYTDTNCVDQGRYLYRLATVKGQKSFGPSAPALGVGSATCRDALEGNDSETRATALDYDRSANLYFYRSFTGAVVQDVDWYSVVVPPRRQANIVITQINPAPGGLTTALVFYLKGMIPIPVTNSQAIPIYNTAYASATFVPYDTP